MKFSEQWLREWVNPPVAIKELAEQLTMAGLEVEEVSAVAGNFQGVVVGEILRAEQHPDADRLRVCEVNMGESQSLSIVCGASNARAGIKVPVAKIGAVLSPDLTIKKAKLRGVESQGMLCSASELGLAESSEGLLELPEDAPLGMDLRKYLHLDDHLIHLNVTPNRGDCLSIVGVAREIALLNRNTLTSPSWKNEPAVTKDIFPITITAKKACPHYAGRIIRGINSSAQTPLWMKEKLRRSDIRSINVIVDVTNYVMLEYGQPMHAFDLQKLSEGIEVRFAKPGERLVLLDEQEVELNAETLVIADARQPHAIAGVMGGILSKVDDETKDIFLESAFFSPVAIRHAVMNYHIQSDSSHRFERGVDFTLQTTAIERATSLILAIAGGKPGPIIDVSEQQELPPQTVITLRRHRIKQWLGIEIPDNDVKNIFHYAGMRVKEIAAGWEVIVPPYRFDLRVEADLIEEVARIYGYDRIPLQNPLAKLQIASMPETQISLSRIREVLIDRGYHEAITYSFVAPKFQTLLDPDLKPQVLSNPISQDMSVMRTSLWPGLVQAVLYNQNRQESRIRLFETGLCFYSEKGELVQRPRLGGILTGTVYPEQWGVKKTSIDFFDVKNDLEAIFKLTGYPELFRFKPAVHPALHPHKSAEIYCNEQAIGYIGALHPTIQQKLELSNDVYLFEVDLEAIRVKKLPSFKPLSRFPMVRRDLAVIVGETISAQALIDEITRAANDLLHNVKIFDIYQGKGIEAHKKSVALALTFQHPSRTLTDAEVNAEMEKIVISLNKTFSAKLR